MRKGWIREEEVKIAGEIEPGFGVGLGIEHEVPSMTLQCRCLT